MGVNTNVNISTTGETLPSSGAIPPSVSNVPATLIPATVSSLKVRGTPSKVNDDKERGEKVEKIESAASQTNNNNPTSGVGTGSGAQKGNHHSKGITNKSEEDFYKDLQQFHERRG